MKISIITPVYNGGETIERTIKSVIEQKCDDLEYIIVDGMSTDRTSEVIKRYSHFISCYIREKDEGIYDAINKGISAATGDIVGIINSDDWYEENCIDSIIKCFSTELVDIAYGDFNEIDGCTVEKRRAGDLKRTCLEMTVPHPTMFVKKSIYDSMGCYSTEYRISSDYDFVLRCYMAGLRFKHISHILANFSLGGISSKDLVLCKKETQDILKKHIDDFSLNRCFNEMLDRELVVHGAGFWGKWLVDKLVKLYTDDIVWVDQNCSDEMKETEFGINIRHPDEENGSEKQIIVAIYDDKDVEKMYLSHSKKVISIRQLLDRYMDIVYTSRNSFTD